MKYNDKQFFESKTEAFEVQEMNNGSTIELHYMDEEPFYMDNINRSRFSVWSSPNGKNYKLFIDKGLYEVTNELYTKDINEIWMEFWDKYDKMRKKFLFFFLFGVIKNSSTSISPWEGSINALNSWITVDLPLPVCPIIAVIELSLISKETSSKALTSFGVLTK